MSLRGFYGNISPEFAMSMGDDGERGEQAIGFCFDNLVVQIVGKQVVLRFVNNATGR